MAGKNDQSVYPIQTQAGIKRDGTSLDGNFYSDGQWCRFRNGRPKKMGGYRELINLSSVNVPAAVPNGPVRGLYPVMNSPQVLIHAFHGAGVTRIAADQNGEGGSCLDRTPAGFTAQDAYTWSVGVLWDATGGASRIVAHAANDLLDITSDVSSPVYYGTGTDVAALTNTGAPNVSGGICILNPFVFAFGSNGLIANCDTNKPSVWGSGNANSANVASTKVVAGMPLRGGANAPSGIFWSLAEIIRVSFIGGASAIWRYDTLTDQSSILAKDAVVEYDGVYYWPGIDRWLMWNGTLKELPNALNQDFFFDNVNWLHRNKCWGLRISRWGEIWWFFPKGTATECNWAVVYNVRENTWYDTPITRATGFPARELPLVLMSDSASNTDSTGGVTGFRIFQHEFGKDKVVNGVQTAINSYFETSDLGFATGGISGGQAQENANVMTRITRLEPDFRQTGPMTVVVTGEAYAQSSKTVDSTERVFQPTSADPATVDMREQRRELRLRFASNVEGGDYHMGKVLMHLEPGDQRPG